jgi:hypothetical protein
MGASWRSSHHLDKISGPPTSADTARFLSHEICPRPRIRAVTPRPQLDLIEDLQSTRAEAEQPVRLARSPGIAGEPLLVDLIGSLFSSAFDLAGYTESWIPRSGSPRSAWSRRRRESPAGWPGGSGNAHRWLGEPDTVEPIVPCEVGGVDVCGSAGPHGRDRAQR